MDKARQVHASSNISTNRPKPNDLVKEGLNDLESPKEAIRTWKCDETIAFWLLAAPPPATNQPPEGPVTMTRTAKSSLKHCDTWLKGNDIYIDRYMVVAAEMAVTYTSCTPGSPKPMKEEQKPLETMDDDGDDVLTSWLRCALLPSVLRYNALLGWSIRGS